MSAMQAKIDAKEVGLQTKKKGQDAMRAVKSDEVRARNETHQSHQQRKVEQIDNFIAVGISCRALCHPWDIQKAVLYG